MKWALLLALAATGAGAEEALTTREPEVIHDAVETRLRYGVSLRSGNQTDSVGPSLSYSGLTPNDLALSAWGWLLLDGHLGAFLSLQREGFALYADQNRVTGGGLIRLGVGPTGRLIFGPVRLEAGVGYAFHQLPTFGNSASPQFSTGTRHGVLLAARALVDVGPVTVEARGEVPVSVAATDGTGRAASSSGFGAGGGLRLQLFRTGVAMWGVMADFNYSSDTLSTTAAGLSATQALVRVGAAIDVKWQAEPIAPLLGELEVRVVDADTGAILPSAVVELGDAKIPVDPSGVVRRSELAAGSLTTRASAGGYLPGEELASIEAGGKASVLLKLKKVPPKVGSLVIKVINKELKTPLPTASVQVGDAVVKTDEQGAARFDQLNPGPIGITVSAEGFNPGDEAASVVAGQESEVTVELIEVKKRIPATITGLVRSTVGGKAISADLEIPQARIKTKATASGAFTFRLEGGTYTVNIAAPGYLPQSKSVTVKDGDQAIFNVDLHPK